MLENSPWGDTQNSVGCLGKKLMTAARPCLNPGRSTRETTILLAVRPQQMRNILHWASSNDNFDFVLSGEKHIFQQEQPLWAQTFKEQLVMLVI